MRSRVEIPYPGDVDQPIRFMDRFTLRDIVRLALPTTCFLTIALFLGLPLVWAVVPGVVLGVILVFVEVNGEKLDVHAVNYLEHWTGTDVESWPEFKKEIGDTLVFDDRSVVGVVRVSRCDLEMLSEIEQAAIRDVVHDLIRSLDWDIEIHSRQRLANISQYATDANSLVVTDHYVVVKSQYRGEEELATRIKRVGDRCRRVRNNLISGDLYADQIGGEELEELYQELKFEAVNADYRSYTIQEGDTEWYHRALYVEDFPEKVEMGWLSDVLKVDGLIDVVQTFEPLSQKEETRLSRLSARLQSELASARDPLNRAELEKARRDTEHMLEVRGGNEVLTNYGVLITVKSRDRDQLRNTLSKVETTLRQHGVEFREPFLLMNQAVETEALFRHRFQGKTLTVPGVSASAGFPFSNQEVLEPGGVFFATDSRNDLPVILDRYSWPTAHIARMGRSGSGKSYAAKLGILRSVARYTDLTVYIIDPKDDEYQVIGEYFGGEVATIEQCDLEDVEFSEDVIRYRSSVHNPEPEVLIQAVRDVYRRASENPGKSIVLIDEAHRLLRHEEGRTAVGELVREGRSKSLSVELITQNSSDFTRSQDGRDILKQVSCFIFMQHQDVASSATEFFRLSENEEIQLLKLRTGSNLPFSEAIIRGPVQTKLRIDASATEHEIITGARPMEPEKTVNTDNPTSSAASHAQATALETVETDGGTFQNDQSSTNGAGHVPVRVESEDVDLLLELPDTCTTEEEEPEVDAPVQEVLPEELPGWQRLKTDNERWDLPVAEDHATATYRNVQGGRYILHISRWEPRHVKYAIDELYGTGHPTDFDLWTARGRYIFAVKIKAGNVAKARTLLTASPMLSRSYLRESGR